MESHGGSLPNGQQHQGLRPLLVVGSTPATQPPAGEYPVGYAPMPSADQPAGEAAEEQLPPPPPPTQLIVDRPPGRPVAVTVETHSMSVSWTSVSVTMQSNEIRVVEYLLTYSLQMQQLEGDSSSTELPVINDHRWSVQYLGPATYVQVKGLRPGRRYAVRVECQPVVTNDETVVVQLARPSEVLLVDTPPTCPDTPAPPAVASRARNTIKFKWMEPEETGGRPIMQYVLDVVPPPLGWEGPPNAEGWYTLYVGPERSFMVKRLQPGVRYAARVKAISSIGESPYSAPMYTSTQATVPSTPGTPLVAAASDSWVTLQWEASQDNGAHISGYQLDMDDGRGNGFMPLHHGLATSFTATGLRSGMVYKFRVRAENSEGRSQWSPACEARTAPTAPASPPPPHVLGSNQSSISIAWKDVEFDGGSAVVGYEVEMQPKCKAAKRGMPDDWVLVFQGARKACTLGNLKAGCTYRVRVRAFNERGPGPFSMPADVCTAPDVPEPPASLAPTNRYQTGLALAWSKPDHDGGSTVTTYRLEMRVVGRLEDPAAAAQLCRSGSAAGLCNDKSNAKLEQHFEAAYVGPETSTEVHELEPGCRYQFQVLAINKQGASAWSQPVMVDTRAGLSLTPDPPQATATTSSTIQLVWQAPYGQGAPVTSYLLQLCRLQALQQAQQHLARAGHAAPVQHSEQEHADAAGEQQNYEHAAPAAALSAGLPMPGPPSAAVAQEADGAGVAGAVAAAGSAEVVGAVRHPAGATSSRDETPNKVQTPSATSALHFPVSDNGDAASTQSDAVDAVFQTAYHGPDLGCIVRDLDPDTEYAFRLRASNSVGASHWSAVEAFRTAAAAPSVPLDLTLADSSSWSAHVSWHPPQQDHGSPLTGYQLEYAPVLRVSRSQQQQHWKAAYTGSDAHCEVSRLSAGREYQLRVRAGNACGWGPWSDPLIFSTQPDVPESPEAPTFSNRMGTSVRVKWQPPAEDNGAAVTDYVLEMLGPAAGGSMASFQPVYSGEATSTRVQQLAPGTEYQFRVRAANGVGKGPPSAVSSVSTTSAPPSPPTNVQAVLVVGAAEGTGGSGAAPSVLVSWEPAPRGELQAACISYEIDAAPSLVPASSGRLSEAAAHHKAPGPAAAAGVRQTCSAKVSQHTLLGLQPGATFWVRVRGIGAGGAGHGDWSEPATVQLPVMDKGLVASGLGGSGSGDEEDEGAAVHSKRRKPRSGSTGDLPAKAHRAQSIGTKTVAAKSKPKKTWLTRVANTVGLPERDVRRLWHLLILVVVLVVLVAVFMTRW